VLAIVSGVSVAVLPRVSRATEVDQQVERPTQ
jgi:type II secretory pathway pseudopilin PulG